MQVAKPQVHASIDIYQNDLALHSHHVKSTVLKQSQNFVKNSTDGCGFPTVEALEDVGSNLQITDLPLSLFECTY